MVIGIPLMFIWMALLGVVHVATRDRAR